MTHIIKKEARTYKRVFINYTRTKHYANVSSVILGDVLPRYSYTAPGGNEDEDRFFCVVCLERPRVVLFLECAHLCVAHTSLP